MSNKIDPRIYPDPVKECWAVHQMLRMLGFLPDDIYVSIQRDGRTPGAPLAFFVVLKAQGLEFATIVGSYNDAPEAYKDTDIWTEFVNHANANAFDKTHLCDLFNASNAFTNKLTLLQSLMKKGFTLPGITADTSTVN